MKIKAEITINNEKHKIMTLTINKHGEVTALATIPKESFAPFYDLRDSKQIQKVISTLTIEKVKE